MHTWVYVSICAYAHLGVCVCMCTCTCGGQKMTSGSQSSTMCIQDQTQVIRRGNKAPLPTDLSCQATKSMHMVVFHENLPEEKPV